MRVRAHRPRHALLTSEEIAISPEHALLTSEEIARHETCK